MCGLPTPDFVRGRMERNRRTFDFATTMNCIEDPLGENGIAGRETTRREALTYQNDREIGNVQNDAERQENAETAGSDEICSAERRGDNILQIRMCAKGTAHVKWL